MTREYPPEVYGGAGVHVTELAKNLRSFCDVDVHCMGAPREDAYVYGPDPKLADANASISMLSTQLRMAHQASSTDPAVVHTHTWYTGFAGHLTAQLNGIPHVVTAHSLEPSRPWKAEQLGGGYRISSWSEKNAIEYADAIIGVSSKMREEILRTYPRVDPGKVHVILNGIDTEDWQPSPTFEAAGEDSLLTKLGVNPDLPIVAFVGRITRQKGVKHLLAAAHDFAPDSSSSARAPQTLQRSKPRQKLLSRNCRNPAPVSSGLKICCPTTRLWKFSVPRLCSCVRLCTSHSGSSTSKRWRAILPSLPPMWAVSQRWWWMVPPGLWSTTMKWIRSRSSMILLRR